MSRFNKMLYLSASVFVLTQASETLANPDMESLYPTLTSHSLELKPAHSFQLARATFLPDTKDNLGIGGRDCVAGVRCYIDISTARGDPCEGYGFFDCPSNATCTPCPINPNKKKLTGCKSGYTLSGNACVAATCSALNSSYKTSVPNNSFCTKISANGLTCYKDCKTVSCSGYNVSCPSGMLSNTYASNGITYQACSECPVVQSSSFTKYNCTPKCKISQCPDKQKLNDAGTACIDKDDNCPNGYYKSCETGIETTVTPKYTEAGTACYQCKAKTPACKVPHCKKCSSSTSNYCTTCEDGYELSTDRKTCREISQCELKGYYNEERAAYYYGDDYECKLTPKLDDGTVCFSDCYTPYACCNGLTALSGKYLPKKDKFSTCSKPSISTTACGTYCLSSGCPNNNVLTSCPAEFSIESCDSLDKDRLRLNQISSPCLYKYNFLKFSTSLDCSGKDVDFSDAYWTGLFPPRVTRDYSNSANTSKTVNRVSLKVKSYVSPTYSGFSMSSIDLTATDKVVLSAGFLADTTITAPKVYIQGNLGMAHSKIIADDIYIAKGVSIGVGGSIDVVTYVIPSNINYSTYTQCSDAPGTYGEYGGTYYEAAIGTPERPAAFHFDTTAPKNDQTDYGVIQMYIHNLTIYGYNAENTPIFSEAVIWSDDYHTTGRSANLTISDIEGKSQSNLFYRFHTQDGNSSGSFLEGKLVYEGSLNGKNQQLCQKIKENSYLYTDGSSSNICSLASAADRVECNEVDYSKATCAMFGYEEQEQGGAVCTRNEDLYQKSGQQLECYECIPEYCMYGYEETYKSGMCENYIYDTYPDKELWCAEVSAGQNQEQVCKTMQDAWIKAEGEEVKYDTVTPITTLPYAYDENGNENLSGKKCVVCHYQHKNENGEEIPW